METTTSTAVNCIADQLPQPLIDYLLDLAAACPGLHAQYFILEPVELSGRALQRIEHQAGTHRERHLVFGFVPLNCVLEVWPNGTGFDLNFYPRGA